MMKKILKEPLLHFMMLGAVLFIVFQWSSQSNSVDDKQMGEIVVTEGRIEMLLMRFEKVWKRPPTAEELQGLVQDYIQEEIMYREALAMNLDRDDTIVRRRMRRKMEFLSEDIASLKEPTEQELNDFYTAHQEKYRQDTRYSFLQVYINASVRGQSAEADAFALLNQLHENRKDANDAGDLNMIGNVFENVTEGEVERAFGRQFLQALQSTPKGSWQGPIESGFGLHLVHISERVNGEVPAMESIREIVLREWTTQNRKQSNEEFYKLLRARYKVTINTPEQMPSLKLSMTTTQE
jgi:parvulin-like peptidyl-prolyl isomerase